MDLYRQFEGNRTIFAEITNMTLLGHFWGVSKIFDLEITMNYIGKTLRRHYDVTSGPIDTKLNYSFIASNYVTV